MVLRNYNFIITCLATRGAMRNLQCMLVTCLHGPYFLMAWNIQVSCNLPCGTCGIVSLGLAMRVTAT